MEDGDFVGPAFRVVNISRSGLGLSTNEPLGPAFAVGATLKGTVRISGFKNIEIQGVVRGTRATKSGWVSKKTHFFVGLQLLDLEATAQAEIASIIASGEPTEWAA